MSKNLSKFMNLLKFFSDYPFLILRLHQKGNLPQVKNHCAIFILLLIANIFRRWLEYKMTFVRESSKNNFAHFGHVVF